MEQHPIEHISKFENIIIQLGISALVVIAGSLLVLTWMKRSGKAEEARTRAYEAGEAARTDALAAGFRALTDSHAAALRTVTDNHAVIIKLIGENHAAILKTMGEHQIDELETFNELRLEMNTLDTKIDTYFDLTPVRGSRLIAPEPSVVVEPELEQEVASVGGKVVRIPERIPDKRRAPSSPGTYSHTPTKKG